MSQTGVAAFDSTIQTTNVWLNEIGERLGWQGHTRAYHALRAVLHALRDRLPVAEAAAFAAQLPMLIRGFYYEGWHPAGKPMKEHRREEFLAHIADALRDDLGLDAEDVAEAVFQVIAEHVTFGEIKHVMMALPVEIRSLWSEEMHALRLRRRADPSPAVLSKKRGPDPRRAKGSRDNELKASCRSSGEMTWQHQCGFGKCWSCGAFPSRSCIITRRTPLRRWLSANISVATAWRRSWWS